MDLNNNDSIIKYCTSLKDVSLFSIINNAGINNINLLEKVSLKEIDSMLQVDLEAPILILQQLIPNLKKNNNARIVNIGSIWAVVSKSGRALYSAAKNGIHGITNALAVELGENGILINTVCPGFTLTDLTYKNNSVEEIQKISNDIPLKRMANPIEIAKLIYFLGSEENTYITGQKIVIDGDFSIK